MLVLTRKVKQQIQIGENIVITILQVRGQTVRVGIEAPRQVRVIRSEISDVPAKTAEHKLALGPGADSKPLRVEAGRPADRKGFSSPMTGCALPVGESSGLHALLRRRNARAANVVAAVL